MHRFFFPSIVSSFSGAFALRHDILMRAPVQKLGVIGANRYSAPLVHWVLARGYPVVWLEKEFSSLEVHLESVRNGLSKAVHAGQMTALARDSILSLLSGTTQYSDLSGCNMVVDMNPDDPEEKREVIGRIEKYISPESPIGISLDTLTVTQLAGEVLHPGRLFRLRPIGLPPRTLVGLEIVAGRKTDPVTIQTASDFSLMLELPPMIAHEGPGGVANRLLARCFSEARVLTRADRKHLSDLDAELRRRGWETLPGETMEKIGRSGVRQILAFFHRFYGDTFFVGEDDEIRGGYSRLPSLSETPEIRTVSEIADLWILSLQNEAVQMVYENVASWETVDRVSEMVFGLVPDKAGLLGRGAARGWSVVLSGVWTLSSLTSGRIWPSPLLHLIGIESRYDGRNLT
ncbi:hypothetical protein BOX30_10595 [Leptospirillum ferriphilum]|nr:hypothetical protein BOX30_10595 [Leptospirillum ferriphilum]